MKRMLINATHSEEVRVALADGQKLYNLDIDVPGQDRKKGNIYLGKITRVEPSLEAAFVEYGGNRHGFLPYKEISRNYYTEAGNKAKERPPINVAVKEGTQVIIQVNKEERGNKGAAITTYVSLAGRYLVYMPENPKAGGISRRIEGKARQELKATLNQINIPKHSGVIVRTAGIGRSSEEIDWDLNYLDQVWTAIKTAAASLQAPAFLYQESAIEIRALRDYLRPDVGEILIDDKEIYEKTKAFMQQVMPHNLKKLSYYNDTIPLFSRYQIESQIQSAFSREVHLPSGGSLVIDHTEAMISIDINSARATKGADIEETALNTNLEAADEIARQMRIRDLGGLLVIDFIDMRNHKNQRAVEQQLNEAVSNDRARIQTSKISKFGLLEMSRQRLKSSINESSQFVCPRCSGHGFIRNIESLSVSIIRIMEEEALKPETGKVIAQVPTKVANFIINDKRDELMSLEKRHAVPMYVIANEHYQTPQFDVVRLKKSEIKNFDISDVKLNKPENEEEAENKSSQASHQKRPVAAVDSLVPDSQAPERVEKKEVATGGIMGWLSSLFASNSVEKTTKSNTKKKPQQHNNKKPHAKKPHHNKTPSHPKKQGQQTKNKGPQHNNKNTNKPKAKSQPKKPVHKNQQTNKPKPKPQHKNQQPKKQHDNKPQVNKNEKVAGNVEQAPTNDQLIQRPLGSVASYAAKKAQKAQQQTPDKGNQNKPTKTDSKKADVKSTDAKVVNKETKVDTKPQGNKVDNSAKPVKTEQKKVQKVDDKSVQNDKANTTVKAEVKKENKLEKDTVTQEVNKAEATKETVKKEAKAEAKQQEAKKPESKKAEPSKAEKPTKSEVAKTQEAKKTDSPTKQDKKVASTPKAKATESKAESKSSKSDKSVGTKKKEETQKSENKVTEKPQVKTSDKTKEAPKAKVEKAVEKKEMPKAKVEKVVEKKETPKAKVEKLVEKKEIPKAKVEKVIEKKVVSPKKKMPDPTDSIDFDI